MGKALTSRLKTATGKGGSFDIAMAGKWALNFFVIGIIAVLGSIVFHYLCGFGMHYFMDALAGYRPHHRPVSTTCYPRQPPNLTGIYY